jgi:hypothetical protein
MYRKNKILLYIVQVQFRLLTRATLKNSAIPLANARGSEKFGNSAC